MLERAECDLQMIISVLGKGITYKLLKTNGTETERDYVNVHVRKNRSGWLWNAMMKVFVPFHTVTSRSSGKRRLSVWAVIYMFIMAAVSMALNAFMLAIPSVRSAFFTILWLVIILIAAMPYVMALIYLQINKKYYKEVIENGEGFYSN